MKIIKMFLLLFLTNISFCGEAQTYLVKDSNINTTVLDYKASRFGIKSDGITLNTSSIQKAIDFINAKGGGRLVFYVGRYLTGSVQLKSNVIIHLEEGAVLVSSESIYDYKNHGDLTGLVMARNVKNTGITGKGVIEGNGTALLKNIRMQSEKGFIDRNQLNVPALISIDSSENLLFSVQNYIDAGSDAIKLRNSSLIRMDSASVKSISTPESLGTAITLHNCRDITISNCFLDTSPPYIRIIEGVNNLKLLNVVTVEGKKLNFENEKLVFSK